MLQVQRARCRRESRYRMARLPCACMSEPFGKRWDVVRISRYPEVVEKSHEELRIPHIVWRESTHPVYLQCYPGFSPTLIKDDSFQGTATHVGGVRIFLISIQLASHFASVRKFPVEIRAIILAREAVFYRMLQIRQLIA